MELADAKMIIENVPYYAGYNAAVVARHFSKSVKKVFAAPNKYRNTNIIPVAAVNYESCEFAQCLLGIKDYNMTPNKVRAFENLRELGATFTGDALMVARLVYKTKSCNQQQYKVILQAAKNQTSLVARNGYIYNS